MQQPVDFEQAIERKFPEPVAIAIVKDPRGKYNPVTISWCTQVSGDPPMLAIALKRNRYSLDCIQAREDFVVAFPAASQVELTRLCGTASGREADKLAESRAPTHVAKQIDNVLFDEAAANFECRKVREFATGDHVVVVGEVVQAHVNADATTQRLYTLSFETMGSVSPA